MNPYPWLATPSYLYLDRFSFAILEASERQKPSVSVLFLSSHSTDTSRSQGCPMQVCFNLGWTEGAKDCPWAEEWHHGSSEGRRDPENQKEGIKIQVWRPRLLIPEDLCQIHTNPRGPTQGEELKIRFLVTRAQRSWVTQKLEVIQLHAVMIDFYKTSDKGSRCRMSS